MRCGGMVRAAMMSPTATRASPLHARASSFSSLPSTRATSGMAAKVSGEDCAAQPVTTMRASGCSRLMRRIVCRAWRTASAVTAQVLTTTASCAGAPARLITSDSTILSRQPKVMTSRLMAPRPSRTAPDRTCRRTRTRTGPVISTWPSLSRQSMVRSPPGSVTFTLRLVRLSRAAATAAAQAAEPQALVRPAPRSQVRMTMCVARDDMRQRDVGALGKHRMVFQQRPEAVRDHRRHVIDPEDRVRIAHIHHRRRMQHRLVDRPDLQFDGAGVAEFFRQRDFVPGEFRRAHVHGEQAVGALPAIEDAARGLEGERALAAFLRHQVGDAAHAVAAGAGFRAVIVVDADEGVGARRARRIKRHQLVVGRAVRAGRRARFLRR